MLRETQKGRRIPQMMGVVVMSPTVLMPIALVTSSVKQKLHMMVLHANN